MGAPVAALRRCAHTSNLRRLSVLPRFGKEARSIRTEQLQCVCRAVVRNCELQHRRREICEPIPAAVDPERSIAAWAETLPRRAEINFLTTSDVRGNTGQFELE